MKVNNLKVIFLLLLAGQQSVEYASAYSSYYSYQTNSVDDGNKVVTNIKSKHYDSRRSLEPDVAHRIIIEPSGGYTNNQLISKRQIMTNNVGTGIEDSFPEQSIFMHPINGRYRSRGFLTKGRNVDSPPLVIDSRGRAGTSVTNELAKLLHIKQGHYSDLYAKLDKQPTGATKPPVDAVEDAVREAVVRLYQEQNNKRHEGRIG